MDPSSLPLFDGGQLRKRWRYVGLFADELMLCAARAEVGPLTQSFWVFWDRAGRRHMAHTGLRPGSREVRLDGPRLEIDGPDLRASLRLGEVAPIETTCPSGKSRAWTRKRVGMPVEGTVEIPGRRWQVSGHGVDDESAGHHQRHTSWRWSAGVGDSTDGRPVAWNLVEGINDPPEGSERSIWIDGEPTEPPPVRFRGMEGVDLAAGERLDFAAESKHAHDENYLLIRSRYRHRFGSFSGALGGVQLARGFGVMEEHDAVW
ncbi:MAG TPA: DUF2804 family protein [Solirubrobacterales bacterium]|nr:DUF2804 family protein [Solirubrobacterales bacterium]